MTTYVGNFRVNGNVYDVIVRPAFDSRHPSKHTVQYRESDRHSGDNKLEEGIRENFLEISDDFGPNSRGNHWKTATIIPNGTGKHKLEAKVQNFLSSIRK